MAAARRIDVDEPVAEDELAVDVLAVVKNAPELAVREDELALAVVGSILKLPDVLRAVLVRVDPFGDVFNRSDSSRWILAGPSDRKTLAGRLVVCLNTGPRCGPTAHNTAVSRCQQPAAVLSPRSALEAAACVTAAATGFRRRLLQPPSSCAA